MRLHIFIFMVSIFLSCKINHRSKVPHLFSILQNNKLENTKELPYNILIYNNTYNKLTIYLDSLNIFRPSQQVYYDCDDEYIERFYGGSNKLEKINIFKNEKNVVRLGITPPRDKDMENIELILHYKADGVFRYDTIYYLIENNIITKRLAEPYCKGKTKTYKPNQPEK